MRYCLAIISLLAACISFAQTRPPRPTLAIERIMQGERFTGYSPEDIQWSADGRHVHFSWNPEMDTIRRPFLIDPFQQGAAARRATPDELADIDRGGAYSPDLRYKAYSYYGDLYVRNLQTGELRQITQTLEAENDPVFSADGRQLIFQRGDNLFALPLEQQGPMLQLTNISREGDTDTESAAPSFKAWLAEDQMALMGVLRDRKARETAREHQRDLLRPKQPRAIYYGNQRLDYLSGSPNLRYVAYRLRTPPPNHRTWVPDFVTGSGFVETLNARPKVGSPDDAYSLHVFDRERDTVLKISTAELPGIYDKPAFMAEYHAGDSTYRAQYAQPRPVVFLGPFWSPSGEEAIVVVRSMDNKDRWITRLLPAEGKLQVLDWQRDQAWVGGPGIEGWLNAPGALGWLPDGKHIYFQSEATGYSHLYLCHTATGEKRALTSGKWEVLQVALNRNGSTFYITANAEGPHEQHFYHLPVSGGPMARITQLKGAHEVSVSPDEQSLAIRYSSSNQPWELYIQDNKPGSTARRLTRSTTPAFEAYPWRSPEIVYFTARDGAQVPARLYRPSGGRRGGPAVIFVHGAGYLQNVHHWWSTYYREYMFHHFLADRGYTVLDIDYRASEGYGRDWRTAIYRHMGGKDLDDQVDGARYLSGQLGVDPRRIGIYGGSYGGFITLMALFKEPDVFACGAALRSVTDWAHYNHPYTANILNTPITDSLAYRRSSPIYYAEGLKKPLLILHGMVDVNVQFQDVVRLSQRLIELGKDQWEMAVFPVEDHGFVEASSWADEYKRIFRLFETHLKK